MNRQAVEFLQQLSTIVTDDSALSHPNWQGQQALSQYRARLLKEITARIKVALGAEAALSTEVQARAADQGSFIEIGCFDAEGQMQLRKPLSIDQARVLVREIEESICEVITRDANAVLRGPSP